MKLQKYVFIGLVIIFTSSFLFPNGSLACWGTSEFNQYECCFQCCSDQWECQAYLAGGVTSCEPNYYCIINPLYCTMSCYDKGADCPIVFALNNDEITIDTLRRFRDEVLSTTPVGQEYIRLYYQWSPFIVKAMEEDEEFKKEVQELIEQLLPMIEAMVQ